MGRTANVAGTGGKNPDGSIRRNIIRRFVCENMHVTLRRESRGSNAIAVYVSAPMLFGILGTRLKQIGYLDSSLVESIDKKMGAGERLTGRVACLYAPSGKDNPRVSIQF
jgi:hypothetical protein